MFSWLDAAVRDHHSSHIDSSVWLPTRSHKIGRICSERCPSADLPGEICDYIPAKSAFEENEMIATGICFQKQDLHFDQLVCVDFQVEITRNGGVVRKSRRIKDFAFYRDKVAACWSSVVCAALTDKWNFRRAINIDPLSSSVVSGHCQALTDTIDWETCLKVFVIPL
ncbi:hypothetical protein PFISCL1PPCAC_5035 [Pristionchus fissidentatus]|uniref:Uncharacterized protein n=1 Tax=Pristionchus fissidentatus TaxID=1538716 RepID=A0AAV5V635_9BILA|nr:hypothetical protein PFISCL1PPCAC_5035 [Pristionchus fissidentatus]